MSELMIWTKVPKGARFELKVTPTTGTCVANAEVVTHDPDDSDSTELWTDADVNPGPRRKALQSPKAYVVMPRVTFPTKVASECKVSARVVKADGTNFGSPKEQVLSGKQGDPPALVTILLRTVKS